MQTKGCRLLLAHIEAHGMTKKAFAAASGLSPTMLSHLLSGARRPTLDVAFAIERASSGRVPAPSWLEQQDGHEA